MGILWPIVGGIFWISGRKFIRTFVRRYLGGGPLPVLSLFLSGPMICWSSKRELGTWAGHIRNSFTIVFVSALARQGAKVAMGWVCGKVPAIRNSLGIMKRVRREIEVLKGSGNSALGRDIVEHGVVIAAMTCESGSLESNPESESNIHTDSWRLKAEMLFFFSITLFPFLFLFFWQIINPEWSESKEARMEGYDLVPEEDKFETVIDDRAWLKFCIFCGSLVICVLWYAFLYHAAGTVNLEWTQIFGR